MAEEIPTEFLIENTQDKKFIGEFIKFIRDNKSQYHIKEYEVNKEKNKVWWSHIRQIAQ